MKTILTLLALIAFSSVPIHALRADDFDAQVRALNGESFSDKIAAVQTLSASQNERVAAILSAMSDGNLYATSDGAILIQSAEGYVDAVTGKSVPDAKADDLTGITVNNRLRGLLSDLLATLDLQNPDPEKRKNAARLAAERPTPESSAALHRALEVEKDPSVSQAIRLTLASVDLQSDDKSLRLAAINTLANSSSPEVSSQIAHLLEGETDEEVKSAAKKVLSSIRTREMFVDIGANIFQGLSLGSVLLLAAIGLAITFGVMGVINMAHGEMIMLGAYTTYVVQEAFRAWLPASWFDAYLVFALPSAFFVTAFVGIALERSVIRFLYGRPLETLLATFGISLILQQVVRSIFGAPNKAVENPSWMTGGVNLVGDFTLTWNRLAIILFSIAVLVVLAVILRKSSFGLSMRAVSQNRPMAAAMGIRTNRIDAMTFGLGSGIAGIAGVALSQIGNVSPNLGQTYIIDSFMVVVFGGVGSLWGTLVGALSLGEINKILEPYAGAMLGKILVLVFIILFIQKRPRGLFALKGRSVEG